MIVLLTGGTRGIGLAMFDALVNAGHKVAVVARKQTTIECDLFIRADLSQIHERYGIIDRVVSELGGLDVLVNNAGAQVHAPFVDYFGTDWDHQIELLLTAPFDLSQQAAKYMLRHGGGHIVNVLSTSAFQGARNISAYVAAKHGLLGLTRAMAIELAPLVRVNAIVPGLIETEMTSEYIDADRRSLLESITPAGRFGKPSEIAEALIYIIRSSYMYGQTVTVDGGWMAKNG